MTKRILIQNLKHIRKLTFDIPGPGVHLLAGANGAGKTSVLACLRRLRQSNAFAQHFSSSRHSESLDNFDGAQVTYTLDERSVTYAYGGERWVPRPRSNNRLLEDFGYPVVFYIGATADRITPRPEDFNPRRIVPARRAIRDAANRIFGTNKFNKLKVINLTRGAGNPAFVLQTSSTPRPRYFSERNFSLGELCVLKLVRELIACKNRSLVLIDELELALHPKAQIELLNYLGELSAQKQLTVVFSTHSVSLLKQVARENILFLESNEGVVSILKGCFPTYALGNIAYDEERSPDVVIYVEDEAALHTTDALTRLCMSYRFRDQPSLFPTVHVVPIGSFIHVVRFLAHSRAFLPSSTRCFAMLDQDVTTETLTAWENERNHAMLAEFQENRATINYLPWTPEVGLIGYLRDHRVDAERAIRERFNDHRLSIRQDNIGQIPKVAGGEQRRACKAAVSRMVSHLVESLPNEDDEHVRKAVFGVFATWHFNTNRDAMMELIGPLVAGA